MVYTAENDELIMRVDTAGAQMCSLQEKKTGREFLWSGNPAYWKGISPVLFPFVGGLKDGSYGYDGSIYRMPKHGFAKDMEFACTNEGAGELWFQITDTQETRACYPFFFTFEAGYVLKGKSVLVKWRVHNQSEKTMYFALGGHPAFACPGKWESGNRTTCSLLFEGKDSLSSEVVGADGLVSGERKEYTLSKGYLPVTTGMFDKDALIFDKKQVTSISICDREKKPYVTVRFETPWVGIWSMPMDEASYICIEPWYGRCDDGGYSGSLAERPWSNALPAGECFEAEYEICVE